jgi:succinyl-diaminopimelate desuccinylase
MTHPIDPVDLTARLVRCNSVTPAEGGALVMLEDVLTQAGFDCTRVDRGGIANLFARWGSKGANRSFGFNGHTDVVPIGNPDDWTVDPFGAEIRDGFLWGRGATDMKSGVAAFVAAACDFVADTPPDGAIILAITGDEEADALDGTTALLDWMAANNERMTECLVGEPTSPNHMGEAMKIGRRGSMTAWFTFQGVQGHSAYPCRAKNPLPAMDTGNPATNVIPATCRAAVNIRFNDDHTGAALTGWMQSELDAVAADTGIRIVMKIKISGESFLTPPGTLSDLIGKAVLAETGKTPKLSTSGGTSDARFVKDHCPVVEFGLVGKTMHMVDEKVPTADIITLKAIYARILRDYFA